MGKFKELSYEIKKTPALAIANAGALFRGF